MNYHFGSKDGLYRAVFQRRLDPVNARRLHAPDKLLERRTKPALRQIIDAFLPMTLSLYRSGARRVAVRAPAVRELIDPKGYQRGVIGNFYDPVAARIIERLGRAFPDASRATLYWAHYVALGGVLIAISDNGRLERRSKGAAKADDFDAMIQHIVPFVIGGITACIARSPQRMTRGGAA